MNTPKPKQRRKKAVRGLRRNAGKGEWLTRSQIALRAGIDREGVSRYLGMEGAPKPNKKMMFHFKTAVEWIKKNAPRLGTSGEEMRSINLTIKRLDAEEKALDLAVKKGEFVEKKTIAPTVAAFMGQLTADLMSEFEQRLAPKYAGKTAIECQQMNAAAIDWVLKRLKAGASPITQ